MGKRFSGSIVRLACVRSAGALLVAWALLAQTLAQAFPNLNEPATRALIERLLRTEAGSGFARAVLGPKVSRFNPAGSQEVINVLLHPENRALAESFGQRMIQIRAELTAHKVGIAAVEEKLVAEAAGRWLSVARRDGAQIMFADGETLALRDAYTARRAEFLMGGAAIPVRVSAAGKHAPSAVGYHADAFEQLLRWEELTTVRKYTEGTQFFGLRMKPVDAAHFEIQGLGQLDPELRGLFFREGKVYWPEHPFSGQPSQFPEIAATEAWPARSTASRSIVIWNKSGKRAFSIKSPTDYPHRTEHQPSKYDTIDDLKAGVYRSEYLQRMDAKLGKDSKMDMLPEIFAAAPIKGSAPAINGNGYIVRELTPLLDGHYYLPAFSIPSEGTKIAQLNGVAFDAFWGENYAAALGRAKAKLLVRYGLQMETPNCQNMLIQLDRQMRPTGKIVFRDVSDSQPVAPIARAIGQQSLLAQDAQRGFKIDQALNPMTRNSLWRLDEDPVHKVSRKTIDEWASAHDDAYVKEAMRLMGYDATRRGVRSLADLQRFMFSTEGGVALGRFHRL